jgi:hypothetical protein
VRAIRRCELQAAQSAVGDALYFHGQCGVVADSGVMNVRSRRVEVEALKVDTRMENERDCRRIDARARDGAASGLNRHVRRSLSISDEDRLQIGLGGLLGVVAAFCDSLLDTHGGRQVGVDTGDK